MTTAAPTGRPATRANTGIPAPEVAPLVLTDGQKGGVGKSQVARLLAHAFWKNGWPLIGIDGDEDGNPHLERFYHSVFPVEVFDLRETEHWSGVADFVHGADKRHVILLDAPGGVAGKIRKWTSQTHLTLNDLERPVFRVWVMSNLVDGIIRLNSSRDLVDLSHTIVILNRYLVGASGERDGYQEWLSTGLRRDLLTAGGLEVEIPALHGPANSAIHHLQCPFEEAPARLPSFVLRKTTSLWLAHCERALAPVLQLLGGGHE